MRKAMLAAIVVVAALPIPQAIAQPASQARVFINVNGDYQATSSDFHDTIGIRRHVEDGTIDADYGIEAAPAFDVGGGARLWRNLAVGVGVSRFSKASAARVTAKIPHPFFFNRAREISGESPALKREETVVHVQAVFLVPAGARFQVAVFGGPSFFTVKQNLVTNVEFSESYPFDTASFVRAETEGHSESKVGFNTGADVAYMFHRNIGVGAVVRFSRASIDVKSADGKQFSVEVGGAQVGGGLRLRF